MVHPPYPTVMSVSDQRVWPHLSADFYKNTRDGTFPVEGPIVPIRCDGVHMPTGREEFEAKQVPPREASERFLAAFIKGNEEAAADLLAPGYRAAGDLAELRQAIGAAAELKARGVRWAGERAVILTTDLPLKSDPALNAPIFLRLAKHADRWLIDRIESRIEEPFTGRLTRVLSRRD